LHHWSFLCKHKANINVLFLKISEELYSGKNNLKLPRQSMGCFDILVVSILAIVWVNNKFYLYDCEWVQLEKQHSDRMESNEVKKLVY